MTDFSPASDNTVASEFAMIFPGQGSQGLGMLSDCYERFAVVGQTFAEASDVLGYDLWALCQGDDAKAINQTEVTQPLLLTASVALFRVWRDLKGDMPKVFAGHSLGEWSALVCAEVVSFRDAVSLVRYRGAFMQDAVPAGKGAMAAIIGLDDAAVEAACAQAASETANGQEQGYVVPVNFNAPGQVVIAGLAQSVQRAIELCKEAGAKRGLPLPVSAPFHTELMRPAAEKLAEKLDAVEFKVPLVPIIHNVTQAPEANPEIIKTLMLEQMYHAVPWVGCVEGLKGLGVQQAVECGAGKVLAGLMKRIDKQIPTLTTETPENIDKALSAVKA